jgi:hypothetical protein
MGCSKLQTRRPEIASEDDDPAANQTIAIALFNHSTPRRAPDQGCEAMVSSIKDLSWKGDWLYAGSRKLIRIVPDQKYPHMWRVELPDDRLTDMVNRSRAKDAALSFADRIIRPKAYERGAATPG